jgi:sugar phosphate isomerase/epimerase
MTLSPLTPGRLSLNQRTLGPEVDLATAIDAAAHAGFGGIAPWREYVEAVGRDRAAKMIRDAGLKVSGICRSGFFGPGARPDDGLNADQEIRDAIADAATLAAAAAAVVVVGGGGGHDIDGARRRLRSGLEAVLEEARAAGVRLALEPLHPMTAADRGCISTLPYALDLVEMLDPKNMVLGVALDAYHVWWEPYLEGSIARAAGRIDALHVCDWRLPTQDLLLDRGLPGDGVANPKRLRGMAEAAGYQALVEVEVFQPALWSLGDAREIAVAARDAALAHA